MRIAQRPAKRNIYRAVTQEGGAVVPATRDAVLSGNMIQARESDDFFDQLARDDVGIVDGADDEAVVELGVVETGRFDGRIGAVKRVDGEDVIWLISYCGEAFGN